MRTDIRRAITIVELLVVVAVIVLLVALLVPAIQKARESAARVQSTNNLKQIALACHGFHDAVNRFPYNGTSSTYTFGGCNHGGPATGSDRSSGSWAFMILPYIDQESMFSDLDTSNGVPVFMCPGRSRPLLCTGTGGPGAWTDYFFNTFLNDPNGDYDVQDNHRTLTTISDGTSHTILVGHGQIDPTRYSSPNTLNGFTDTIFHGGSPGLCRPNIDIVNSRDSASPPSAPGNWGGPFAEGSLMAMADGSVRIFSYTLTGGIIIDGECTCPMPTCRPDLFGDFLTPSGDEVTNDL